MRAVLIRDRQTFASTLAVLGLAACLPALEALSPPSKSASDRDELVSVTGPIRDPNRLLAL